MTWVTWVTWGFVAIAASVAVVAWAISTGRLDVTFEPPYERPAERPPAVADGQRDEPPTEARRAEGATSGPVSGIEWSEPAAGRPGPDGLEPHEGAASTAQNHPPTTGEPADGRHEAQDR